MPLYETQGILVLDRPCLNTYDVSYRGYLFDEYTTTSKRSLFFEDYESARLYAKRRGIPLELKGERAPEVLGVLDLASNVSPMFLCQENYGYDYQSAKRYLYGADWHDAHPRELNVETH